MIDLDRDVNSLLDFQRDTPEFLRRLKESGQPVVITIDGKAELIVQDSASHQSMMEVVEKAELMDAHRASIDDMRAGRVVPAESMLAEMREILAQKMAK